MPTYGPLYPSGAYSVVPATNAWTSPTNIEVDDNVVASDSTGIGSTSTDRIIGYQFNFAVPSTETIVGYKIEVKASGSQDAQLFCQLVSGINHSPTTTYTPLESGLTSTGYGFVSGGISSTLQYSSLGSLSSVDFSFQPAQANATEFGVLTKITGTSTNQSYYIDAVRLTIQTSAPGTPISGGYNPTLFIQGPFNASGLNNWAPMFAGNNGTASGTDGQYFVSMVLQGPRSISGNFPLFIGNNGTASGTDGKYFAPLFEWGFSPISGNFPMFLLAQGITATGVNNTAPLFEWGYLPISGNPPLFMQPPFNASGQSSFVPMFEWGNASISGNPPLFMSPMIPMSSSIPMLLQNIQPISSAIVGFSTTGVPHPMSGMMPLFLMVNPPSSINNNIPLFLGASNGSGFFKSIPLFTANFATPISGILNLFMNVTNVASGWATMPLVLQTSPFLGNPNGSITLLVQNQVSGINKNIPLLITTPGAGQQSDGFTPYNGSMNLFIQRPFDATLFLSLLAPGTAIFSPTNLVMTPYLNQSGNITMIIPSSIGPINSGIILYTHGW